MLKMMLKVSSALRLAFGKCSRRIPSKVDARTFLPEEISAFLVLLVMNNRSTDVVQRWCMFTTRLSLFKAVLFSAKMRKAREREKELGVGRERENFVFVVVLFCVECRGREERGKKDFKVFLGGKEEKERIFSFFRERRKICLILKVARQTKKQEVARSTTKKRRKRGRKRARFTRCSCYVLCCLKR